MGSGTIAPGPIVPLGAVLREHDTFGQHSIFSMKQQSPVRFFTTIDPNAVAPVPLQGWRGKQLQPFYLPKEGVLCHKLLATR